MDTYIALLRGINVSGQKKIKMADLKALFTQLGFLDIQTYIQSGNIVFKTETLSTEKLDKRIKEGISATFGFDVPVLVHSAKKLKDIRKKNTLYQKNEDPKGLYYVLLKQPASPELVANLKQETYPNEVYVITDECVYLNCLKGYGNAKCNNNFFERKLKVVATTRNHKTIAKLLALSEYNSN